ncbi:MAG: sigma 54-interacting transcriptional regulator [Planctomycetaceae bacterium]|nr:sigma 54-interacting transcriptional regulator [Planctomycetaceae bacterium]
MATRTRRGLATWLTNSLTPIFVLDDRRVVLVFNRGCEELTQWPMGEVIGKTCVRRSDLVPQELGALTSVLTPPATVFEGAPAQLNIVCPRRDGSTCERSIWFLPLSDADGSGKFRVLGLFGDVMPLPSTAEHRRYEVSRHLADLHQRYGIQRMAAVSPAMQRVASQVALARRSDSSIHFQGDLGTGKEHLARLIHYASPRRTQRFLPVRCETASHFEIHRFLQRLTEQIEDGAEDIGTVYLNRVDQLSRDHQEQVLAMTSLEPIRWMSSSFNKLDDLREEEFSEELRYRLTSIVVDVPVLKRRHADLPILVQQFIDERNLPQEPQRDGVSSEVESLFLSYDWPGNVEELERVVAGAYENCPQGMIGVAHLPWEFRAGLDAQCVPRPVRAETLDESLERYERRIIIEALQRANFNRTLAAELLGIPRPKLYRRLEALGLTNVQADNSSEISRDNMQ